MWGSPKARGLYMGVNRSVSAAGLEPATNGLKGHCSAIELRAHVSVLYGVQHSITLSCRRQRQLNV